MIEADAVLIIGDAAKGRLAAGKPLELVVVCELKRRRALNEALRELDQDMETRFGLKLDVLLMTRREAPTRWEAIDGTQLLPRHGKPWFLTEGR